jgi:hypothetical protein
MTPWLVLVGLVATANLALLLLIRGRWGRLSLLLALAALGGTVTGDAVAGRTGLELVRIGDFHLVAASVGAQVAMLAVLLVATVVTAAPGPARGGGEDRG